jgi:DNA polymerase III epsilon subunit-like protein
LRTQRAALDREDVSTGETLLDTLVKPEGVPVEPGARALHRITNAELAAAPGSQPYEGTAKPSPQ